MLALKAFVHESVTELDDTKLRTLAETLRIDARGCDDRRDLERVVTGLLCLDHDTSLGVFVAWLRASDANGVLAPKKPFHNTFVPKIAPANAQHQSQSQSLALTVSSLPRTTTLECDVKEHHLSDEIATHLRALEQLEVAFKAAERVVHAGAPSFDKLKQFLVALTQLRSEEEVTRRRLMQQNAVLSTQHAEMRAETLHTRAQLDFFVDGFANLRRRHDALLETSTQSHAESDAAVDVLVALAAHESHFAAVMAHTLEDQRAQYATLQKQLAAALARIDELEAAQTELRATVSALKHARGNASKDAHCAKRQLRACKRQLAALTRDDNSSDTTGVFCAQVMALREALASLLTHVRDAVVRDTKTPKQVLSRETLRVIQRALDSYADGPADITASSAASRRRSRLHRGPSDAQNAFASLQSPSTPVALNHSGAAPAVPRVLTRRHEAQRDLDEAVRGVLLLGSDGAACAAILTARLRYAAVDVRAALESFAAAEHEGHRLRVEALASHGEQERQRVATQKPLTPDSSNSSVADRSLQLAMYGSAFRQLVADAMARHSARGVVLFNWDFTSQDVNVLIALGLPVDSVLDLQPAEESVLATPRVPPPQLVQVASLLPPTVSSLPSTASPQQEQQQQQPASSARSQVSARTLAGSPVKPSSTKAPNTNGTKPATTPSNSTAKSAPGQVAPKTPESSRRNLETPAKPNSHPPSATGKRPSATPASSSASASVSAAQKQTKPLEDRKLRFPGQLHLFERVAPATFADERVDRILEVLAIQRAKRATPIVQWDDATQRTNELLAMFAEDVHMMLVVEHERRKSTKPGANGHGGNSSAMSSVKSTAANSSTSRSTSPSRAVAAPTTAKPLARGSLRSPDKPTATARGSGATAVATSRRATAAATSPTGPDRSKRASVAASLPSAKQVPSTTRK